MRAAAERGGGPVEAGGTWECAEPGAPCRAAELDARREAVSCEKGAAGDAAFFMLHSSCSPRRRTRRVWYVIALTCLTSTLPLSTLFRLHPTDHALMTNPREERIHFLHTNALATELCAVGRIALSMAVWLWVC